MNPKDILVVKLDGIGDFALGLPALYGFREKNPDAELDVVVSSFNASWRDVVPWVRTFYTIDFGGYRPGAPRSQARWQLAVRLVALTLRWRRCRYAIAIDLRTEADDWRGKLLAWLSGAPIRIGGIGAGALFLTQATGQAVGHQSERLAARLHLLSPRLEVPARSLVSISRQIAKTNRPRIVLHPGAGNAAKRWPVAHWRTLAQSLSSHPGVLDLHLLGGIEDETCLAEIGRVAGLGPDHVHLSTTLRETLQILADADLLVGLDSAAPHLAYLVETPAITIFSAANDAARWRALGDNTVLLTPIECSPCELPKCKWETHRCMEAISPSLVLTTMSEKLRQIGFPEAALSCERALS